MASDKYLHFAGGKPSSKPKTTPPQSLLSKAINTGISMAVKVAPKGTSIGIKKGRPYIKTNTPGKG